MGPCRVRPAGRSFACERRTRGFAANRHGLLTRSDRYRSDTKGGGHGPVCTTAVSASDPAGRGCRATEPRAAGRGRVMLLQLVWLAAFWAGVYVIHEKALAFKKADAKRGMEGKWQSIRAPGVILELR